MESPGFFHLLAYLYIGFAKVSNNDIPYEQEMAIKKKIGKWLNLSYRNIDQFEGIMGQSLEWFNETPEAEREATLLEVAKMITLEDQVDDDILQQVLSEIRDISVSDGQFERGEKVLHDKISNVFGLYISTVDRQKQTRKKPIGFKYSKPKKTDK